MFELQHGMKVMFNLTKDGNNEGGPIHNGCSTREKESIFCQSKHSPCAQVVVTYVG